MTGHHQVHKNDINSSTTDSYNGSFRNGRGERRNFVSQVNKLGSSRQTMATDMTSSRFSTGSSNHSHNNNMINAPSHNQMRSSNQMRRSYNSHSSREYPMRFYPAGGSAPDSHEERELQRRRAEENAAWVKMLEEESLVLQGADRASGEASPRMPNRSHYGRASRSRSNSPSRSSPNQWAGQN